MNLAQASEEITFGAANLMSPMACKPCKGKTSLTGEKSSEVS